MKGQYNFEYPQTSYITEMFIDAQATNDRLKKDNKRKEKNDKNKNKKPWYILTDYVESTHPTLSTGEAYRRLARKEYEKGRKHIAERYMRKARENGILSPSNEDISRVVQEYTRGGDSAVKGLKKASTRIIRAIVTPSTKSEVKGNKNYEKMRKLGLVESAEKFKENPNNHTYRICIQRKTSDKKYGIDNSYIFSSEHTNCPASMIQRHIVDIYGRCRKDTSFERIYTIDVNGTINWYEREQLENMLEKRVEEQNNFINQKAA